MVIVFYTVLFTSSSFVGHWQTFQITVSVVSKIDPAMLLIGEEELVMASGRKGVLSPETKVTDSCKFLCEY